MRCPQCGSEMVVREGLRKVYYCSAECGLCIEDINLGGAAHRLAGDAGIHRPMPLSSPGSGALVDPKRPSRS